MTKLSSKIIAICTLTFLLTSCLKIDTELKFQDGKITPSIETRVSEQFLVFADAEDSPLPKKRFKNYTSDERKQLCDSVFSSSDMSDDPLMEILESREVGFRDGFIFCEAVGNTINVNDFSEDRWEFAYDAESKQYEIDIDLASTEIPSEDEMSSENKISSEVIDEPLDDFSPAMLGFEMNVEFAFGRVDSVTLDGQTIEAGDSRDGVTVSKDRVSIDVLDTEAGKLAIKASDSAAGEGENSNLDKYAGLGAVAILIGLAVGLLIFGRSKRSNKE